MINSDDLKNGVARTQADMDKALRDPVVRNEVAAIEARYESLEEEPQRKKGPRIGLMEGKWTAPTYEVDQAMDAEILAMFNLDEV